MLSSFALDYAILVFFSTLGALQIVAALNGLSGIMALRGKRRATLVIGGALVVAAFTWFFSSEFRNHPDTGLGLDANEQAALFALTAGFAVALTLVASSMINAGWARSNAPGDLSMGLSALRHTTFTSALAARLRERKGPALRG